MDGLLSKPQKLESFTLDVFNSHQFQGSLQAIGGAVQVGAGLALCETGVGAPLGILAIAQGADFLQAGIQQVLFNKAVDPLAVQGLQATGMTHRDASLFNGGLSMALGGGTAALASKTAAIPSMRLAPMAAKGDIEVGSQIWSSKKAKTSVQNAFKHWKDHKNEFPELRNSKQYVEKAWAFFKSPPNGTLFKTRCNGDQILYHVESNTFGIKNAQGIPKTMFKPNPSIHKKANNLRYFYDQ